MDLAADMGNVFLADFGEDVTYVPLTGDERPIRAIIDRNPPMPPAGSPVKAGLAPKITAEVANDATAGISSSEINTGGDKLKLPVRIGEAATARPLVTILRHDAGSLLLGIN
jgi:hypothetical protein